MHSLKTHTVQNWRKNGFKVRVSHMRVVNGETDFVRVTKDNRTQYTNRINPCGGSTVVTVTTTAGKDYAAGVNCYHKDNYNKRIGVAICLGRIARQIDEDVADKTESI